MRNQYPGKCYRCGCNVETGRGIFERIGHKWALKHEDCVRSAITQRVQAAKTSIAKLDTILADREDL